MALAAVVAAVVYVGLAWWVARAAPAGSTAAGVALGGLTAPEARVALAERAASVEEGRVAIRVGPATASVVASSAGIHIDPDATVTPMTQLSLAPRVILDRLRGGIEYPVVTTIDAPAFDAALRSTISKVERPVVEASYSFTGGLATGIHPRPGLRVDLEATARSVAAGWPARAAVDGVVHEVVPRVGPEVFNDALEEVAQPAVAGPLALRADGRTASLPAASLAPALSMVESSGTLELRVAEAPLLATIRRIAPGLEQPATNASYVIRNDGPEMVGSAKGRVLEGPRAVDAVTRALTLGPRVAELELQDSAPSISAATVQGWGITAEVGRASVRFADPSASAERVANAARAAGLVHGTLVAPRGSFSLNERVGARTSTRGFVAPRTPFPGAAGEDDAGVSHLASAVFEAAFRAGLSVGPRTPHSVYVHGLTAGLDARTSFGGPDASFTAPSDSGVLVTAAVRGATVEVILWGTPGRSVAVAADGPRALVTAGAAVDRSPVCVPRAQGQTGFDITVTRVITVDGAERGRDSTRTRYAPLPERRCAG